MKTVSNQTFMAKKSFWVLTAFVVFFLASCKESPYIKSPGENEYNNPSMPILVPDTDGIVISVDSAIAICMRMAADQESTEQYKLSGVLTVNSTSPESVPGYSNINFKLSDNGGQTSISCYYINNLNNMDFKKMTDVPLVGSKLTVLGTLTNYKGTTPELKNGFIVRIDSMVPPVIPDTIYATCDEAKEAALNLPNNNEPSKDIYIIEGYVQSGGYNPSISRGQQIFWIDDIKDGDQVFEAYYCNVPNGEAVPIGTKVRLTGKIMKYNTTPEMKNGKVEIIEPAE